MNKSAVILHVPHASTAIPDGYQDDYIITASELAQEHAAMSDLHTDVLFPTKQFTSIVFEWSRLFVDVERFRDDALEPMAGRGMGVLYENGHRLQQIRRQIFPTRREQILSEFYDPHHARLANAVDEALAACGSVLIVDCHSFPKNRSPYEDISSRTRPQICIGTDSFHTPNRLLEKAVAEFAAFGYSVDVDYPFAGSITPLKHYRNSRAVSSVMFEVRRDSIVDEERGGLALGFTQLKGHIQSVIEELRDT